MISWSSSLASSTPATSPKVIFFPCAEVNLARDFPKDIANSEFLSSNDRTNSAHRWGHKWYKPGRLVREEEIGSLRVNHYYTKSLSEHLQRQNTSRGRPRSVEGFFEKNDLDSYSINNVTAKPNADGSYTIQFGGCTRQTDNCLVTPPGWNYSVRMYRPGQAILDGSWKFPQPAQ